MGKAREDNVRGYHVPDMHSLCSHSFIYDWRHSIARMVYLLTSPRLLESGIDRASSACYSVITKRETHHHDTTFHAQLRYDGQQA
jgi:hypothetical protein